MTSLLKLLNENHWYIFAAIAIIGLAFWTYGCESQVQSLLDDTKQVNRQELEVELEYIAGIAKTRVANLDKQDEIKQAIFDALVLVSQGGQVNTLGLVNLAATIGVIAWGLDRNKKLKDARTTTNTTG